jgi:hypothetical protein
LMDVVCEKRRNFEEKKKECVGTTTQSNLPVLRYQLQTPWRVLVFVCY